MALCHETGKDAAQRGGRKTADPFKVPREYFQYVVTSGRRLGLEPRICRFEADHTDQNSLTVRYGLSW